MFFFVFAVYLLESVMFWQGVKHSQHFFIPGKITNYAVLCDYSLFK